MTQLTKSYGYTNLASERTENCLEQIHVLRRGMEAYYQHKIPLIAVLINFKKTFDLIDREMLWKILRNYGIPKKIVNVIAVIYSSSKIRVRLGGKLSEDFHIITGVLQGETLAPFLFIIVLEYILKQTEANYGIKTHRLDSDVSLPDLDFDDYIVFLDSNETTAGEYL